MKKAVLAARVVMGLALVVFGLNGFFQFMEPPQPRADGAAFINALIQSGYLWPLKSAVEVAAGVMLLTGVFAPLGLVIFAPVLVNIVAFHLYLDDPITGGVSWLLLLLELFLAWAYAPAWKGVLSFSPRTRYSP